MADAAATAFLGEAVGGTCSAGKEALAYAYRKINYASDLHNNYRRFIEEGKRLFAMRDDVEDEVNKDKTKSISKEFRVWIDKVRTAEKEVQGLTNEYTEGRKRPFRMWHLWSRSDLSERLAKKCEELHGLWEEGRGNTEPFIERPPDPVRPSHASNVEKMSSLYQTVKEILAHLRDCNVKRVGLWGTVGIGKTTIMHNLNDNKEIAKMFDIVMIVSASKDNPIEKLQNALAGRLKLGVETISDPQEASWRISRALENKRYLLLLDEVWEALDLQKLGILDDQKDSKVVFASRYRDVCCDMKANELVNMKRLSEEDEWNMFQEKAGQKITLPGVEPIARLVAKECAGLPLLIDRIARCFRRKDNLNLWRDGLANLRRWPSVEVQEMDEVLNFLKFCYDQLDDQRQKMCFLYGALYREDCDIHEDYLLECWIAEGFMSDARAFTEARDNGHTILHCLINVSLLERSENKKCVRMNKVLRNMALKISSENKYSKLLVKAGEGLKEPPNDEEWNMANRISLMDNSLCTLPETVDCKGLLTLMLQRNHELSSIPDLFFETMKQLRVLDLHRTRINYLPPKILSLTSLRALYLNSCGHLMELPSDMTALRYLEVLDIRGTGINHLPCQIGHLLELKCLRISLSNSRGRRGIQGRRRITNVTGIISGLSSLEELSIDVDPCNQWWDRFVEVITKEVASLKRLKSLSYYFPSVVHLKTFVRGSSLWSDLHSTFQFSVGYHKSTKYQILDHFEHDMCKCLKYANGTGVDPTISDILAETYAFELVSHKGISYLSDFGIKSINEMRGCLIEECSDIQAIIDGSHSTGVALGRLEKMVINNAPKLICIWEGPIQPGSLSLLTTLSICKCPQLKTIFSLGMIQQLSQLQHLKVEECHEIGGIILESEYSELEPDAFPCLKTLKLIDLPKLTSIWTKDSLEWPSLECITIYTCQSLMRLPFCNRNAQKLRYIEAQGTWWSQLEWQDDAVKQKLRSICNFSL